MDQIWNSTQTNNSDPGVSEENRPKERKEKKRKTGAVQNRELQPGPLVGEKPLRRVHFNLLVSYWPMLLFCGNISFACNYERGVLSASWERVNIQTLFLFFSFFLCVESWLSDYASALDSFDFFIIISGYNMFLAAPRIYMYFFPVGGGLVLAIVLGSDVISTPPTKTLFGL